LVVVRWATGNGNGNGQRATGNGPSATASPRDAQVIFAHARAVSQRDYVW